MARWETLVTHWLNVSFADGIMWVWAVQGQSCCGIGGRSENRIRFLTPSSILLLIQRLQPPIQPPSSILAGEYLVYSKCIANFRMFLLFLLLSHYLFYFNCAIQKWEVSKFAEMHMNKLHIDLKEILHQVNVSFKSISHEPFEIPVSRGFLSVSLVTVLENVD